MSLDNTGIHISTRRLKSQSLVQISYKISFWKKSSNIFIYAYFLFTSIVMSNSTVLNISFFRYPTFSNYILHKSDGLEDFGTVQWHLAVALIGAWVVIFLCLMKGIKSVGKVVYVTALLPYLLLTSMCTVSFVNLSPMCKLCVNYSEMS